MCRKSRTKDCKLCVSERERENKSRLPRQPEPLMNLKFRSPRGGISRESQGPGHLHRPSPTSRVASHEPHWARGLGSPSLPRLGEPLSTPFLCSLCPPFPLCAQGPRHWTFLLPVSSTRGYLGPRPVSFTVTFQSVHHKAWPTVVTQYVFVE